MTYIDTNQHSFLGYLFAETHSPQISSEFGIYLSNDIHIDSVVVFLNDLTGNELWDHWIIIVYFILKSSVEVLLSQGIRYDD
jgi:hypothetical protein